MTQEEQGKGELIFLQGKIQSLREKYSKVTSLLYELVPLDPQTYSNDISIVYQSMKSVDPNEKDISQYDELLLGKIQGQSAFMNFKPVIQSVIGQVNEEKYKAYIKQKTQQKNYGLTIKDRNCSLKQIKKLQSLKKYFDIKQIAKKRKHNVLYRGVIKSLQKVIQLFDKIDQLKSETILLAFDQHNQYIRQEKKFQTHIKQGEVSTTIINKQVILESPKQIQIIKIPETQKIEQQIKVGQIKQLQQQKQLVQNGSDNNKTPKKNGKSKKIKKQQTTNQNPTQLIQNEQKQKLALEQKQKTIKKQQSKQRKLDFFIKKPQNTPTVKKATQKDPILIENQVVQNTEQNQGNENKMNPYWNKFGTQNSDTLKSFEQLRSQLRGFKMEDQQYNQEPYFINIIITLSTIEYYDYYMKPDRNLDFASPFSKIQEILYFEDESQEFEGQSASGNNEEQQQSEEQLSENNTILDDDHLSFEQLSSCESNEIQLKIEYGQGIKWIFNTKQTLILQQQMFIVEQFSMICLEPQPIPLKMEEQQERVEIIISPQNWKQIYKITHGFFGAKDIIIKQISQIIPNVSKNWIDSVLKERSQKIGTQRFIKKEFIEDLKEKLPQIQQYLQKVIDQRNDELKRIRDEKNFQKDQKLEKDILECTGSRYIINLIKQLKQKGYKTLRRKQLMEFINERHGQEWSKIKAQMNTMSIPINIMIKNLQNHEAKCDEEVIVDDEEFNKPQIQIKQDQSSKSSAKVKKGEKVEIKGQKQKDLQVKIPKKKVKKGQKIVCFKPLPKKRTIKKRQVRKIKIQQEKEQQNEQQEQNDIIEEPENNEELNPCIRIQQKCHILQEKLC